MLSREIVESDSVFAAICRHFACDSLHNLRCSAFIKAQLGYTPFVANTAKFSLIRCRDHAGILKIAAVVFLERYAQMLHNFSHSFFVCAGIITLHVTNKICYICYVSIPFFGCIMDIGRKPLEKLPPAGDSQP
jgi:hypothetical protein